MRHSFVLLFLGAALWVIGACAPGVDIESEKEAVRAVLDQWRQMWDTEDMDAVSQLMAHDTDMVTFGTDAVERWVGWEALKESVQQHFDALENVKISASNQVIKVHESGQVAWFSLIMDWSLTAEGQLVTIDGLRLTGVLEKRNGNWVFVQFHASVPVAGQAAEY